MTLLTDHLPIVCPLAAFILLTLFTVIYVRKARERNRILRLDASAFHELAVLKRNSMLRNDLTKVYTAIKKKVFRNSGEFRFGMKYTLHKWRKKYAETNAEQFEALFVKPLSARLEKDGFTVEYLPAGSVDMKKYSGSPAIDLKWSDIKEPEEEPSAEEKPETHWN